MTDSLSIALHAFNRCVFMSVSVDEMLHPEAEKKLYMCFNQNPRADISTLNAGSRKLEDIYIYIYIYIYPICKYF